MATKAQQKREARERRLATKEKHKLKLSPLEMNLLGELLTTEAWQKHGGDLVHGLLTKIENIAGRTWPIFQAPDDTDVDLLVEILSVPVFLLKSNKGVIHYQQNPLVALSACGRYFNDPSVADNEGVATDVTCGSCKKTLRNEGLLPRE